MVEALVQMLLSSDHRWNAFSHGLVVFTLNGWFTFFVNLFEKQIIHQWYFIHIYDAVWSDWILPYLAWVNLRKFLFIFLVVRRELLTQSHPWPDGQVMSSHNLSTAKIFNFYFGGDCFGYQSDLHSVNPLAGCSLWVYPVFKNIFKFAPPAFFLWKAFIIFLHLGSSSCCSPSISI